MASIHPPVPTLHIEYYLEEHVSSVLEATPLHVTYKAYDHDAALLATSALLAHGHRAFFIPVPHLNQTHWHVHAKHA
jgi:hypothetical protein